MAARRFAGLAGEAWKDRQQGITITDATGHGREEVIGRKPWILRSGRQPQAC